jgi:hypothetical protein
MKKYSELVDKIFEENSYNNVKSSPRIRSLDGFFTKIGVEDQEDESEPTWKLDPEQKKAIDFARSLSTKAQGELFNDPQKKINKAYGTLMNQVADKIKTITIK